jgi:hypothetical protein
MGNSTTTSGNSMGSTISNALNSFLPTANQVNTPAASSGGGRKGKRRRKSRKGSRKAGRKSRRRKQKVMGFDIF